MRTRFMTALVMVAGLLLVVGQALAQLPTFQPGDVLRSGDLNRIVDQVRRNANAAGGSGGGATHNVDCTAGETIQSKMDAAQPGDTIMIAGTCNEAVLVNKDGITLDGGGSAVIDGMGFDAPTISINGHQNVVINGLRLQNGLHGVRLAESAAVWLENVTAQGSRSKSGYDSAAGIVAYTSSTVVLTGTIVANDNAGSGISAGGASTVVILGNVVIEGNRLPPVSVEANGNGWRGIEVSGNGELAVYTAYREYATVDAKNNGGDGIAATHGANATFSAGTTIEATDNGGAGFVMHESASAGFYGDGVQSRGITGVFNDNGGSGIGVAGSSALNVWDGGAAVNLTATGNTGSGLAVANGSAATFNSPSSPPSSRLIFNDNGGDGMSADNNATIESKIPLEAKNNDYEGVDAWGGSSINLHAPIVTDNDGHGIEVNGNSSGVINGATATDNAGDGIEVSGHSFGAINGATVTDNAGNGIEVNSNSSGVINGATVTGNAAWGVGVVHTSSAILSGCDVTSNGGDGLHTANNSTVQFYDLTVTGNSGHGIGAYNHAFVSSYEDAGSSITGNAMHGIQAWNGASLQLWNPTVTGNTNGDVNASFGSRFAFYGGDVGDIYCDESVLSQGDWVCPDDDDESDQ